MLISDFEQGQKYRVSFLSFISPDGSPSVPSALKEIEVLEPASAKNSSIFDGVEHEPATPHELATWSKFVRYRNLSTNKVALLSPDTVKALERI